MNRTGTIDDNPISFEKDYLQIPLDGCLTIFDIDRLPPGTTLKLNKDYYYSHKALWKYRNIIYCPAHETAYKLDLNDPRDRKLLEHYANLGKTGLPEELR